MTKAHRDPEDRRLRRKTAAFRLKHDVGKALRWSAPDDREADAGPLRARLAADLLPVHRPHTGGGPPTRDVVERFFEWKKEEGPMFGADDPELQAIERAIETIAAGRAQLLSGDTPRPAGPPSLSSPSRQSLSLSSLVALDDACLEASRACTAFYRRIAVEDGPEIVRAPGTSGAFRRRRGGGA
jgi:hypothetical protein